MFFFLLIHIAFGGLYGVDISQLHSVSIMQCFVENGYTFIIPRCQKSTGVLDDNCYQNVANAHAAGMSRVDVYFLPCYSYENVAGQITSFWNTVVQWDVSFERIWLDIEGKWSSNQNTNKEFFMELINTPRSIGFIHGIYCSYYF